MHQNHTIHIILAKPQVHILYNACEKRKKKETNYMPKQYFLSLQNYSYLKKTTQQQKRKINK